MPAYETTQRNPKKQKKYHPPENPRTLVIQRCYSKNAAKGKAWERAEASMRGVVNDLLASPLGKRGSSTPKVIYPAFARYARAIAASAQMTTEKTGAQRYNCNA